MAAYGLRAALVATVLAALAAPLRAEELVTDLSEHLVAIESTFTGTELLLFGAVEAETREVLALERDVVVVVRGPATAVTTRRKARVAGIWINYGAHIFDRVPGYYAVVSTRPLDAIASSEVLERHEIGVANLRFATHAQAAAKNIKEIAPYRLALIRLKSRSGLYRSEPGGVTFRGDTLFRANVTIPANVPVGIYTAEVFLFRDGKVIHAQSSPLYVSKSGFERFMYNLSQRQPLIYGLLAVAIALISGWVAAETFRRR